MVRFQSRNTAVSSTQSTKITRLRQHHIARLGRFRLGLYLAWGNSSLLRREIRNIRRPEMGTISNLAPSDLR